MDTRTLFTRCMALCLALVWLGGCVQTKTTPGYARAGDNVVIGLGGLERNAGGVAILKPDDLTITLIDYLGGQHNLQARYVFKSYPDHAALLNSTIADGSITNFGLTDMVAFDGGWFAMVPLTLPGQYDMPLQSLAVGEATISVSSPKLTNIGNAIEGDLSAMPIEIIAGTSPEDNDFQRQFTGYIDSGANFVISPDDLTGISEVGGAYVVINYSDDSFFKAGSEPMIVPLDHNPYVQLNYNHVSNGDGTGAIYMTLLNPAGFKTAATAAPNSSLLSNLTVKLMYFHDFGDNKATEAKASFNVDTVNSYYIGLDGAVLSGLTPTMAHIEDL